MYKAYSFFYDCNAVYYDVEEEGSFNDYLLCDVIDYKGIDNVFMRSAFLFKRAYSDDFS